jgi:Kef-type K+ transport system membrane component KefB
MLAVSGIGIIIAAVAGLIGFSLAIGAFFAGLVFSRDPEAVKMEASFLPVYEFLSPFFFIGIGLKIDPDSFTTALSLGCILAVAAIFAKVIADGIPVSLMRGMSGGLLIGTSMVPRAEITMVIMQKGLSLGDWAVPQKAFGAMVVVSAATCIISPVAVRAMLRKWPQGRGP